MQKIKLGKSDLEVSNICFGCDFLWEKDYNTLLKEAVNLGINFFDTADIYGAGKSEELLAKALGKGGFRKDVIIATKVGMELGTGTPKSDKEHIIKSCEESLKCLRTDYIDLYYVHCYGNPEATSVLKDLQAQGKIRWIGVSNYNNEQLLKDAQRESIVACQIRFNYLQQGIYDSVRETCRNFGMHILAYSPLCKGLMTGKFKGNELFEEGDIRYKDPMFLGEEFKRNIQKVNEFRNNMHEYGLTPLKWMMEKSVIPVVGNRNVEQLKANAT